jgi:hypothetical protein
MRRLANALEQDCLLYNEKPIAFDMRYCHDPFCFLEDDDEAKLEYGNGCGTVACIGGHAEMIFKEEEGLKALGLNSFQRSALFYPDGLAEAEWKQITREIAIYQLRRTIKTGFVAHRDQFWLSAINEYNAGARLTDEDIASYCDA